MLSRTAASEAVDIEWTCFRVKLEGRYADIAC